jgi:hypothetical protein
VEQSASNAAWTANGAKTRAKNINIALVAIPHQQGVPLQSQYLFHGCSPPFGMVPEPARASVIAITVWSFFNSGALEEVGQRAMLS